MVVAYCFLISTAKSLPQFVYDANSHIILTHEINSTLYLLVRQRLSLALPSYWRNLLSSCDNPPLERNHSYSGNKIILFSKNIYFLLHIYYIIIFYNNQLMVAGPGIEPGTPRFSVSCSTNWAIQPWQGLRDSNSYLRFWRPLFCHWTKSLSRETT